MTNVRFAPPGKVLKGTKLIKKLKKARDKEIKRTAGTLKVGYLEGVTNSKYPLQPDNNPLNLSSTTVVGQGQSIRNVTVQGWKVTNVTFRNILFVQCDFEDADLWGVKFVDCIFQSCTFSQGSFHGVLFVDCQIVTTRFDSIRFTANALHRSDLVQVRVIPLSVSDNRVPNIEVYDSTLVGVDYIRPVAGVIQVEFFNTTIGPLSIYRRGEPNSALLGVIRTKDPYTSGM